MPVSVTDNNIAKPPVTQMQHAQTKRNFVRGPFTKFMASRAANAVYPEPAIGVWLGWLRSELEDKTGGLNREI